MNGQVDSPAAGALAQTKPLVPGYLVTPFGWAAQPLAAMIQSEPGLLTYLFELDRPRMHVIALALAHLDESPASDLATVLFRGSIHEILHRVSVTLPPSIDAVRNDYSITSSGSASSERKTSRPLTVLRLRTKSAKRPPSGSMPRGVIMP